MLTKKASSGNTVTWEIAFSKKNLFEAAPLIAASYREQRSGCLTDWSCRHSGGKKISPAEAGLEGDHSYEEPPDLRGHQDLIAFSVA